MFSPLQRLYRGCFGAKNICYFARRLTRGRLGKRSLPITSQ
jgi:hypothetical protein